MRGGGLGLHLLLVSAAGLPPLSLVLAGIRLKTGWLSISTKSQEEEEKDEEGGDGSAGSVGEDGFGECCKSQAGELLASALIACMNACCQCRVTAVNTHIVFSRRN